MMMTRVRSVFWNDRENRIRALWRLAGQFVITIAVALILQYTIIAGIAIVGLITKSIPVAQIEISTLKTLFRTFSEQHGSIPAAIYTFFSYLGGTWVAGRLLDRRRFANLGFRLSKTWRLDLGFGLFLGAFLMTIVFLIELAAGWVTVTGTFVTLTPGDGFPAAILYPIVLFILVGIQEEAVGRGYQLTNLAEGLNCKRIDPRWSVAIAALISAAIFGLAHSTNPHASVISTLCVSLAGIFLALGFVLTGELGIPIGLHITWNLFQGNVFGFPVSGTAVRAATFISVDQRGPDLWTGGSFGPEAGLLGVGAMAVGCLLILGWVKLRDGEVSIQRAIASAPVTVEKNSAIRRKG